MRTYWNRIGVQDLKKARFPFIPRRLGEESFSWGFYWRRIFVSYIIDTQRKAITFQYWNIFGRFRGSAEAIEVPQRKFNNENFFGQQKNVQRSGIHIGYSSRYSRIH